MALFTPLRLLGLIALAVLVTGQKLAHDDPKVAPPLALFFYYGYMNEWWVHQGLTTIGGRACRDVKLCTFDQFLDATTTSKGGYSGGLSVADSTASSTVKRLSEALVQRGMKSPISWNAKELVVDAPSDKDVYDDHIQYVLNAFEDDQGKTGFQENYHAKALDALTLAAEYHTSSASKAFAKVLEQRGVTENPQYVKLPLEGSVDYSGVRDAIDMINLVKVFGYERLQSAINSYRTDRANRAAIEWADYQHRFRPCRSYDGSNMLPPVKTHPPIDWP